MWLATEVAVNTKIIQLLSYSEYSGLSKVMVI